MKSTLVFANQKGGVGKTSLAAATAASAAQIGVRTLAVDLDKQGNLASRFGVVETDDGKALFAAVTMEEKPVVVRDVRPGLDVLPGGRFSESLGDVLRSRTSKSGPRALRVVSDTLATVGDDYDLVVIDTPVDRTAIEAALMAATHLVIPTRADDDSTNGFVWLAEVFAETRAQGLSSCELAGVAVFDVDSAAKRVRAEVRQYVQEVLGGAAPVFESTIRHSTASAIGMRQLGLLPNEYADAAAGQEPWYKRRKESEDPVYASATASRALADDYAGLTREILEAVGVWR